MKIALRIAGILVAFALLVAAGLVYPYTTRGHELLTAIWERKHFAWALLVIPFVLFGATLLTDARRPHVRIGAVFPLTRGPRGFRTYLRDLPGITRAAAMVFLVGAMCRPVNLRADERGEDKGIDVVIVMDLSGSMRAVLDGNPSDLPGKPKVRSDEKLTRLETAKIVVKDFISRRKSDRIGVVVFAKNAYILSPPTLDYALLTKLVSKLTLSVIDDSGTAIGDGLATAVARMKQSKTQSKVVILLTDGDNNAGKMAPLDAAEEAVKYKTTIHTIQIGTGELVEVEDGRDITGRPIYSQQKFPVNPQLLEDIAKTTGGKHFVATNGRQLTESMHTLLDSLKKTRFEAPRQSKEELFPLLLFPGVGLVALEILLRVFLLRRFP
ncbi:MAG: VWA domain-containing protein [Polyangiaceae bacterium]